MSNFKNLVVTPTHTGSSSQLLAGCLYHVVQTSNANGANVLQLIPVLKTKDSQGSVTTPPVVNLHQPVRLAMPPSFPKGSIPANAQLVQQLGSTNYIITTPTNHADASKTIRVDNKLPSVQNTAVALDKPLSNLPSNQTRTPSYILMNPNSPLPVKTIPLQMPAHTELKTIPASSLPISMHPRIVPTNTGSDTTKVPNVIYVSPMKTLPASCKPVTSSKTTTPKSSPAQRMLIPKGQPGTAAVVNSPLKWVVQENPESKSCIIPEKSNAGTKLVIPPLPVKTEEPLWPVISNVTSLKDSSQVMFNNKVYIFKKKDAEVLTLEHITEVLTTEHVKQDSNQLPSEKEAKDLANKVVEVLLSKGNPQPPSSNQTPTSGGSTRADRPSANFSQTPSSAGSTRSDWSSPKSNQLANSGGATRTDWSSPNSNPMPSSAASTRTDWSSPNPNKLPSSASSTRAEWSSPNPSHTPSSGSSTTVDRSSPKSNQTPSSGSTTRADRSSGSSNHTSNSGGSTRADRLRAIRPKLSTPPQVTKSIPEVIYIDDDDDDDDVQVLLVSSGKPQNVKPTSQQVKPSQPIPSKVCTPSTPLASASLGSDNQNRVMAHTGTRDVTATARDLTTSSRKDATVPMKLPENRVMAHVGTGDVTATVRDVTTSSRQDAAVPMKFPENRVMGHTGTGDVTATVRDVTTSSRKDATVPMKFPENRAMAHTGTRDVTITEVTTSSRQDATVLMKFIENRVKGHTGTRDVTATARDVTTSSRQDAAVPMKFPENRVMAHTGNADVTATARDVTTSSRQDATVPMKFPENRAMAHTGTRDVTITEVTTSSRQDATVLMKFIENRVMGHTGTRDVTATVRDVTTSSRQDATVPMKFPENRVMAHTGTGDVTATVRDVTTSSRQDSTVPMKFPENRAMAHTGSADVTATVRDVRTSSRQDATVPMKFPENRVLDHMGSADITAMVRNVTTSSRQCASMLMKFTEFKEKEPDVTQIAGPVGPPISDRSLRKKFGLVKQEKIILSRIPPLPPPSQSDSGSGEVTDHTESPEKRKSSFSETSHIPKRRKSTETCDVNMNAVPRPLAGDDVTSMTSSSTTPSAGSSHVGLSASGDITDGPPGLSKTETNTSCSDVSSSHPANHNAPETSPDLPDSDSFYAGDDITGYFSEVSLPGQTFPIQPPMYPDDTAKDEKIQRLKEALREREQALEVLRRQKWF